MTRMPVFSSPLLLGFDEFERLLDRATKATDSYPPYNIARAQSKGAEIWSITLAVAGFARTDLEVTVEDRQLVVKGRQKDEDSRDFLHRGIAARQFAKAFVLADGMEVTEAKLENGLLTIQVRKLEPQKLIKRIEIRE